MGLISDLGILVVTTGLILGDILNDIFKYIIVFLILSYAMIEYLRKKLINYIEIIVENIDEETSKKIVTNLPNENNEIISEIKSTEEINPKSNENIIEKKEDETVSDLINEQNSDELEKIAAIRKKRKEILNLYEKKLLNYENRPQNIFKAVARDDIDEVKYFFFRNSSNINAQGLTNHMTPLHFAAEKGYFSVAELLIKLKARINPPDVNKNTPLHWACFHGHYRIVKLLLAHRADKNSQNKDNHTPLHIAICRNKLIVVQLLIENGADESIQNIYGFSALEFAKKLKKLDIVKYMEGRVKKGLLSKL